MRQCHRYDKELLLRGFERVSPESRYRRFLAPMPELTEAMVRYLGYSQDKPKRCNRPVRAPGKPDFEGRSARDCPSEVVGRTVGSAARAGSGR